MKEVSSQLLRIGGEDIGEAVAFADGILDSELGFCEYIGEVHVSGLGVDPDLVQTTESHGKNFREGVLIRFFRVVFRKNDADTYKRGHKNKEYKWKRGKIYIVNKSSKVWRSKSCCASPNRATP